MASNASTFLFNYAAHISLIVVLVVTYLIGRCSKRFHNLNKKLKYYLFWNGSIRLFMEAYIDFSLFSMLNIKDIQWPDDGILTAVTASNYLAYACFGLCCSVPFLLFFIACCNHKKWGNNSFTMRFGAFLDGTSSEVSHSAVLIIASTFFIRRMMLCLTLVFWQEFLWG